MSELRESILIVAAHPDDEALGCGGTIAKLSRMHPVHVKFMGRGVGARNLPLAEHRMAVKKLAQATRASAEVLAITTVFPGQFDDNAFDSGPLLELVREVEQCIAQYRPTTIYTHHAGDLNIDHRLTFQAGLTACRPMVTCSVRNIYSFEVPSATDWAFQQFQSWNPTRFVDITETLIQKMDALEFYKDELRPFPHPRSLEAIHARATWWGGIVGTSAAEAFMVIRELA